MTKFRDDCAKIAAYAMSKFKYKVGNKLKFLSDTFAKSILSLNRNCVRKAVKEHILLGQYKTLEARFQKHQTN
jgi:hypothetical protein